MSKKTLIAAAVGTAFVASMTAAPIASAAGNPFALSGLSSGYQVAQAAAKAKDGKCGEGKCGAAKAKDGKCGEGKCGMSMADTDKDGKISKAEHDAMFAMKDANKDGFIDKSEMDKMGEGKCGGAKAKEGKCGGTK